MSVKEFVSYQGSPRLVTGSDAAIVNAIPTENAQVVFAVPASQAALKATTDRAANRLIIASNAAEVQTAQNTVQDFSVVFSQWQRIACIRNNPRSAEAELANWTYQAATDSILGSLNTGSTVGFISQRPIPGDYAFEVEVSSTNGDDDFIGIFVGYVEVNGVCHTLTAVRTAGANGGHYLWGLYYDFQGFNTSASNTLQVNLAAGNYDLIYPDGNLYPTLPGVSVAGWNAYKTLGVIKIKAQLVGSVLTVQTSNPGQDYSEASKIVFDLNSRAETRQFMGGTKIGYMAQSQPACTWKSLLRPGSRADYVDASTMTAWSYNGTAWVQATAAQLSNYIQVGRHYYNDLNRKLFYYDPVSKKLVLVAKVAYDFATNQQVIDGVANNLLVSPAGLKALYDSVYPS